MNRYLSVLLLLLFLTACSSDDNNYNNPNLLNVNVNFKVNLSLPQFNPLKFPANPVYVGGYGNGGVIIVNTGSANYVAFDAADPNHTPKNCSTLEINGIEGVCQCDDHNTYNLFTGNVVESKSGGSELRYTMQPYQVVSNGDGTLRVQN